MDGSGVGGSRVGAAEAAEAAARPPPSAPPIAIGDGAATPGAAAAAAQDDGGGGGQWACDNCTFLNPAPASVCDICRKTRVGGPPDLGPSSANPSAAVPATFSGIRDGGDPLNGKLSAATDKIHASSLCPDCGRPPDGKYCSETGNKHTGPRAAAAPSVVAGAGEVTAGVPPYGHVTLYDAPDGTAYGPAERGAVLRVLAADGAWLHVEVVAAGLRAWVRRRDDSPPPPAPRQEPRPPPGPPPGHWRCGKCEFDNDERRAPDRCGIRECRHLRADLPDAMCMSCVMDEPRAELITMWADEGGCGHHICIEGLEALVKAAADGDGALRCAETSGGDKTCGRDMPLHLVKAALVKAGVARKLFEQVEQAQLSIALRGTSFVKCPRCKHCAYMSQRDVARPEGQKATCAKCKHAFCSKCVAHRLHYHLPLHGQGCVEAMAKKKAAWLQWRADGQAAYLRELAKLDAAFAQKLRSFAQDEEQQRANLAAFQADEAMKANWVHCPHCNALWAGSDACPSVTCGTLEAAMGGQRAAAVGCGRAFSLTQGRPYQPAAPPKLSELAKPEKGEPILHPGVHCSRCRKEIRGPRFRCLHCPKYDLCLTCMVEGGPDHAAEEEWPGKAQDRHVFDIYHHPIRHPTPPLRGVGGGRYQAVPVGGFGGGGGGGAAVPPAAGRRVVVRQADGHGSVAFRLHPGAQPLSDIIDGTVLAVADGPDAGGGEWVRVVYCDMTGVVKRRNTQPATAGKGVFPAAKGMFGAGGKAQGGPHPFKGGYKGQGK